MVIHASDRIAQVLERNGDLLDVLIEASPHFERLRNPAMRRVMARLVTVEQAARVAGIDPVDLVQRLNAASARADGEAAHVERGDRDANDEGSPGEAGRNEAAQHKVDQHEGAHPEVARPEIDRLEVEWGEVERREAAPPTPSETSHGPDKGVASNPPPALSDLPPERIIDLDVRDDLRSGREPFSRIMAARAALPAGSALRLRAIFEPVPLYHVMARQGLTHWTEKLADDDWRVWFYREAQPSGAERAATPATTSAERAADPTTRGDAGSAGASAIASASGDTAGLDDTADADPDIVVLDVRGLDPPEPMVRTLAALESLPRGATLLQINVRVPEFLLPRLDQLGFTYEIRPQGPDLVRVFIRHGDERPAADITGAPTDALHRS